MSMAMSTVTRKAWIPPTSEMKGSVAELVQIFKVSGNTDNGNTKRCENGYVWRNGECRRDRD